MCDECGYTINCSDGLAQLGCANYRERRLSRPDRCPACQMPQRDSPPQPRPPIPVKITGTRAKSSPAAKASSAQSATTGRPGSVRAVAERGPTFRGATLSWDPIGCTGESDARRIALAHGQAMFVRRAMNNLPERDPQHRPHKYHGPDVLVPYAPPGIFVHDLPFVDHRLAHGRAIMIWTVHAMYYHLHQYGLDPH